MLKNKANQTGFTFVSALLTIIVGVAMLLGGVVSHANAVAEEPETMSYEQVPEWDTNAGRFCVVAGSSSGTASATAQHCGVHGTGSADLD